MSSLDSFIQLCGITVRFFGEGPFCLQVPKKVSVFCKLLVNTVKQIFFIDTDTVKGSHFNYKVSLSKVV
jgi:hypothetical protein